MDRPRTILLVEDDFILAMNEARQLESEGYRVLRASSGEKAVELVGGADSIDLILMDINLGSGIDGTEAAEIILNKHNLPLLFLSSHTEKEIVEKTERITNYGYVVKNSSFTVLDASIKMAFKLFDANERVKSANSAALRANEELQRSLDALRQASESLALSEEKYSLAFQLNPDAIIITSLDGGYYREVNEGFLKITGFTRAEVIGKTSLLEGIDMWVDAAERARFVAEIREKGIVSDFEADFRTKNGGVFHGLMSARPFTLNGEACLLSITRDETEKRKLRDSIAESESRFKAAFYEAPIGLSLTEFDGSLTTVNQAFCDMVGYSMKELNQITLMNLTHPDDVELSLHHMRKLHDGAFEATRFEKRYIHKDGHVVWAALSMSVMRDAQGRPQNFITHIIDITAEKLWQDSLTSTESALKKAQSVAHLGSWRWLIKSNRLEWSDEMYRIFGIDKKKFSGSLPDVIAKAIHPDDREKVDASNDSVRYKKTPVPLEYRIVWDDGSIRTVWAEAGELILDEHGEPESLSGIVQDITVRKSSEERILQFVAERETFIREIHHRVKNNMNTVASLLSYQAGILEGTTSADALFDAAGRVKSMGILYDKIYRSADVGHTSPKDYLESGIREMIALFPPRCRLRVETDIEDIGLDEGLLSPLGIMLYELVSNSMKHAFGGRTDGVISLAVKRRGRAVVFVYSDDGVGMPDEVSPATSPGFGMTLIRSLAEQMGARLAIAREGGTTYSIELGDS